MSRENIKIPQLHQSLNETILKLMETPDAFMIVCPIRVQLRVSWRDSHCPKWNKHPCLHKKYYYFTQKITTCPNRHMTTYYNFLFQIKNIYGINK